MKGRLLETVLEDPYSNIALEEAIFLEADAPVLRVWENQESVVIGRAQRAEFETDLGYCMANSIPVVRRMTGGGAVYNGPGNLNWSFFIPREQGAGSDAKGVFRSFAGVAAGALKGCGHECEFVPPNSIVDSSGKVSGMAAFISRTTVLCHGTLLVSADLRKVERLTKPKAVRLERRYARSKSVPVSNCHVSRDDFVRNLVRESGYQLEQGRPTEQETVRLQGLLEKYRSERWNLGDPFGLHEL